MQILVTGGSGFVGSALADHLLASGHSVIALGTSPVHPFSGRPEFTWISADTTRPGDWQAHLARADAVINLAGRSIFKTWTEGYKAQLYDSRVKTTRNIAAALPENRSTVFLSTSAAGFYGDRGEETLTEDAGGADDFLARVCRDWETEALAAREKGCRVAILRFGVVLGKNGGALAKMLPAFKLGAGGPLGGGRQWFPWIHMADLIAATVFVLQAPSLDGPVNFTAPTPVRQRDFARALGRVLCRPAVLPAPAVILRLVLGEMGTAVLSSQKAVPQKLTAAGFEFQYPDIDTALASLIGNGH